MAVKALNDTAGPNGFIPTLLVYGAYLRINYNSLLSKEIVKCVKALSKAKEEL